MSLDEAKKLRAEAKSLRDRIQAYEDAKLTEAERAEKKRADEQRTAIEAERTTQERITRWAVHASATKLGIHPDLAAMAIDRSALTFDDNGDPSNVDELIGAAIAKYGLPTGQQPVAAAQPNSGNVGAPARSATGATVITNAQLNDFTFLDNWEKQHSGQKLWAAIQRGDVRVAQG